MEWRSFCSVRRDVFPARRRFFMRRGHADGAARRAGAARASVGRGPGCRRWPSRAALAAGRRGGEFPWASAPEFAGVRRRGPAATAAAGRPVRRGRAFPPADQADAPGSAAMAFPVRRAARAMAMAAALVMGAWPSPPLRGAAGMSRAVPVNGGAPVNVPERRRAGALPVIRGRRRTPRPGGAARPMTFQMRSIIRVGPPGPGKKRRAAGDGASAGRPSRRRGERAREIRLAPARQDEARPAEAKAASVPATGVIATGPASHGAAHRPTAPASRKPGGAAVPAGWRRGRSGRECLPGRRQMRPAKGCGHARRPGALRGRRRDGHTVTP